MVVTSDLLTRAWAMLDDVKDPEIPMVSVVELGIIHEVHASGQGLCVDMMPTFVGCPALDLLKMMVREALAGLGPVEVRVVLDPPWTTHRISEAGRAKLKLSGFAPPPRGDVLELPMVQPRAECPYCGSLDTRLENAFGPTLCRAIHYCKACRQPFEQFKAV